jgi:hypothetical protein
MEKSDLTFVETRKLEIDGMQYSIGVYQSTEGYMAFCDCLHCRNHNVRTTPKAAKEAAIQECRELLDKHHAECHSCPPK